MNKPIEKDTSETIRKMKMGWVLKDTKGLLYLYFEENAPIFFFLDMRRCRGDIIWALEFALPS